MDDVDDDDDDDDDNKSKFVKTKRHRDFMSRLRDDNQRLAGDLLPLKLVRSSILSTTCFKL